MAFNQKLIYKAFFFFITCIGLYLTSRYSYLLFHSIAELFSIVIGFTLFVIMWNSKNVLDDDFDSLSFIGVAYLFISFIDLIHTLSYKGMAIFTDYDYYANQLWIGARYLEAISFLIPFLFLRNKKQLNKYLIIGVYTIITSALMASVFYFKTFPICYVEGLGQTSFKIVSQYIICIILAIDAFILRRNKHLFNDEVYIYLLWSILVTIASELMFTQYVSNYGFFNLLGHYFKILSFYFIYLAVVKTCIIAPFETIFKELSDKKDLFAKQAAVDEMTGLYNRRAAFEFLGKLIKQVDRTENVLTICFIDVDNLKKINDRYGHIEGDNIIIDTSKFILAGVRESDFVCRLGGDEFLIIFPNCNEGLASAILSRIKDAMTVCNQNSSKNYRIDFSYGFAEYQHQKKADVEELIEEADRNMYSNKQYKRETQRVVE